MKNLKISIVAILTIIATIMGGMAFTNVSNAAVDSNGNYYVTGSNKSELSTGEILKVYAEKQAGKGTGILPYSVDKTDNMIEVYSTFTDDLLDSSDAANLAELMVVGTKSTYSEEKEYWNNQVSKNFITQIVEGCNKKGLKVTANDITLKIKVTAPAYEAKNFAGSEYEVSSDVGLTEANYNKAVAIYNLEKTDENTTADVASYRKSVISVAIKGYGEYKVVACKDKNFYLDYTGKETPEKTPEETPKKEFKTELTYKAFDSDKKEVEGKVTNGVFFPPYYDNDVEKKDADAVATITSKTDEEIISTNGVAMKEDGTANSEGWYYADKNNKKVISKKYPFDTYDNTTDNGKVSEEVKIAGKDGGASTEKPAVEWTFRRVRKTETTNKDGSVTVVIEYNLPVDKSTIPSDWEPVYDNDGKTIHKIKRTIKKGTNYSKDVIVGQNGNKDKKVTTKVEKVWVLPQTGASSAIIIAVIAIAGAGLVIGKSKMKKLK